MNKKFSQGSGKGQEKHSKGPQLESHKIQNQPVSHQTIASFESERKKRFDKKGGKDQRRPPYKDKNENLKQKQERYQESKFDFEEVKFPKGDNFMHFLNPYESKYSNFDIPVFYHNSAFYKSHWSDKLPPPKKVKSKVKAKVDKAKYDAFVKGFSKISESVTVSTEKASLEEAKKIYRTINQKVFEPTEEEKVYFDRFGLPNSVIKHKKLKKGVRDFDAFFDLDSINSGLAKGDFLEGNIRMNEFNKNVAYISVENLCNDIILTSEKDQNRALDRDRVVVRLIDPKYWEPLRKPKSGVDNEKSIRELAESKVEEEKKATYLQESKGDDAVDDAEDFKEESEDMKEESEDMKEESEDLREESEDLKEDSDDNKEESDDLIDNDEVDSDDVKSDKESEEEGEASENDKSILKIIKDRKEKIRRNREENKDKSSDNGLRLPANIKSGDMLIEWINTAAKDFRPKGKVVFIKEPVHFGKDIVMILRMGEKQLLHKLLNTKKEEKMKMIENAKADVRSFMKKHKTLAVPINKRLKWAMIDALPDEFWEDIEKGEDPCKRYYL